MTAREKTLARVREALRLSAPLPGHHGPAGPHWQALPRAAAAEAREWLPPVDDGLEAWISRFAANSEVLKTTFLRVAGASAAIEAVRTLAEAEGWKKVAHHGTGAAFSAAAGTGCTLVNTDAAPPVAALEDCDAAVTTCDALVAQTGSVVVTARSCGGRALSVLPPHHVVLATTAQLVPDLPAAFQLLQATYGGDWPSMVSFVTGPSRTADIERILVLGAHGPRKLTVVLAD